MSPSQPTITIIGGSIWGNRGAAAMLETTIGRIHAQLPDARIFVYTPYPLKDKELTQDVKLEFFDSRPKALVQDFLQASWYWLVQKLGGKPKFSGAVKAISESMALLDVGGITFSDGRLLFLPYNILTIWPAMLLNIPVIKMSQAAGSFQQPIIRWFAKLFLPRCAKIFARGSKTYQYLIELGLEQKQITQAADIAFLYKSEYCLTSENTVATQQIYLKLANLKQRGNMIVAISPSMLVLEKSGSNKINYNQVLLDMIKGTSLKNVHFLVFPNASRERSRKARNNDILAIESLRVEAELSLPRPLQERITWITFDVNTRGIDDLVLQTDVLVASRFHAMIFGLRLCVPTLVIGWGHKYMEAMQAFQMQQYVFDYRDTQRNLSQILDEMLIKNQEIRTGMTIPVEKVKQSSEAQFQYLKEFLNEFQESD
jgi:polysaccharide pyruvyl transferase WcaK-like protein